MFNKLFFALLFISVCFTQQTTSHPYRKIEKDIVDEIIKLANEAVNKLKILVEQTYLETSNTLTDLRTEINQISDDSQNFVFKEIDETAAQTAEVIDNTAQKFQEINADYLKCFNPAKEQLKNIVFLYRTKEEQDCILLYNSLIDKGFQTIISYLIDAEQHVLELAQEAQNCAISADPLACGTKVIADVQKMEKQLPEYLNQLWFGPDYTKSSMRAALAHCGSLQIFAAGTEMFKIYNKVFSCLQDM